MSLAIDPRRPSAQRPAVWSPGPCNLRPGTIVIAFPVSWQSKLQQPYFCLGPVQHLYDTAPVWCLFSTGAEKYVCFMKLAPCSGNLPCANTHYVTGACTQVLYRWSTVYLLLDCVYEYCALYTCLLQMADAVGSADERRTPWSNTEYPTLRRVLLYCRTTVPLKASGSFRSVDWLFTHLTAAAVHMNSRGGQVPSSRPPWRLP